MWERRSFVFGIIVVEIYKSVRMSKFFIHMRWTDRKSPFPIPLIANFKNFYVFFYNKNPI